MKIQIHEEKVKKIFNNSESYEDRQERMWNEDLIWYQRQAADTAVNEAEPIKKATQSIYNRHFALKLFNSCKKKGRKIRALYDWSTKYNTYISEDGFECREATGKLMNTFKFDKCDEDTIYLVPEARITDERPHDFFLWKKKNEKYLAIEIQDFTFHSKPFQKHNDYIKAQYLLFNSPGPQFIPVQVSGYQIRTETSPQFIEEVLEWFEKPNDLNINSNNCDIPF